MFVPDVETNVRISYMHLRKRTSSAQQAAYAVSRELGVPSCLVIRMCMELICSK